MPKQVTLMIGPQGSGKSAYAKENQFDVYINQDSQGKTGHFNNYLDALKTGKSIVVDRINHTKEQRLRYLIPAKEMGYKVNYKLFSAPYNTLLSRVMRRENHETIKANDEITARKALDMYFSQFEYPNREKEQYDYFIRPDNIHGQVRNIIHFGRTIIIGDLHGCYQDLMNLLDKVKYNPNKDLLICAGDLNDRGPETNKIIKFFTEHYLRLFVRGNHDDKFIRYLKGNKVNVGSLKETILSFGDELNNIENKKMYYDKMIDAPYIICLNNNNYISHAGFHPFKKDPLTNTKEFSIYARYFNKDLNTFSSSSYDGYWYDYMKPDSPKDKFFFGHIVHEDFKIVNQCYPLDAGACFGVKLRCAIVNYDSDDVEIVEINSTQPKVDFNGVKEWDHMNKFEPYDKLVSKGYLRKQESGDLVLYNYTEKTTYERFWNKYTMECRGLILDKNTGDTVARPFPKFFNIGELENKSLPQMPKNEKYDVYEKMDGSLGILYFHPNENMWKIATRGSFESDQAKKATEMFHNKYGWGFSNADFYNQLLGDYPKYKDYTFCFEIIYPKNRMNDGARLVCDYGTEEMLVLLGGVHKVTGKDLDYDDLKFVAKDLFVKLAKKYEYTIDQLHELKKTLPMTEEGWVIRFENGYRVKIKGDEYCRMTKILNSISPLSIWEIMFENKSSVLPNSYKILIPEEIIGEVNAIESKLQSQFDKVKYELIQEYNNSLLFSKKNYSDNIEKGLGLCLPKLKHRSGIFPYHHGKKDAIIAYVLNNIRPKGNVINEL